jgi:hypothetical protein
VRALAGLGVVAAAEGEAERAVVLLTASQSLIAKLGLSFPSTQSAWLQRHVEMARAQLEEERFASVVAQAQVMMMNEAVEYALDEAQ